MDIQEAKAIICSHCTSDECEWCQVKRVVYNVEHGLEDEGSFIPSKDYGPCNPWDAPGMSISDFL